MSKEMNPIFGLIGSVLKTGKFWDIFKGKEKLALEFQQVLAERLHVANQSQVKINLKEAESNNLFVAGWRPAIGWISALALFYQYIVRELLNYYLIVNQYDIAELPKLDISQLVAIVTGMLGIYGYRTFEKTRK